MTGVQTCALPICSLLLLYGVLMVVEVVLIAKYVRTGVVAAMPELVEHDDHDESGDGSQDDVLAFAY